MLFVTVERESDHHDRPDEEEARTDLRLQLQQENAALRPSHSYAEQLAKESSEAPTMEAEAQSSHINGTQHEFLQISQQPYNLETTIESSGSQSVAPLGTLLPASAYINFINGTYSRLATTQQSNSANAYTDNNIVGNEQRFHSSSTSEPNDNTTSLPSVAGHLLKQITEGMNRDMNSLRKNSVFKCYVRSSDLQLNTTAHSGEDLNVPGNGSAGSGTGSSSDEVEEPPHDQAGFAWQDDVLTWKVTEYFYLPSWLWTEEYSPCCCNCHPVAAEYLQIWQGAHKIGKKTYFLSWFCRMRL